MKFKKLQLGITALVMTAVMAFSMAPEAFASEETDILDEGEGAVSEGAPDENGNSIEGDTGEGGEPAAASQGGVVMSGLATNNGREIAAQFPEEYIPEGFHKSTCTYEGQTIEIAYMDKGNGEVVLAYLADSDGSNGDFYLCDINTAEMSDFVQIYGGEGKYIIVLDPRDMVVAPTGFTKANLQWYGKSVSAWLLPGDGESGGADKKKEDDEAKTKTSVPALLEACAGAGRTLTVYAAGGEESSGDTGGEGESSGKEGSAVGSAIPDAEDGSGVVAADPSQYFMVYAINQDGVIGFYLYDTSEATYQRYVQVDSGEGTTVERYRSSAQRRLIVIAVLAVALVICLFVMINLIIRQRDRDDDYEDEEEDEEDDEMEQMRRRVARKEKSHIRTGRRELNYLTDDDEEEEDEEDDEDDEEEDGDEPDWEHMEIGVPETRRSPQRRLEDPVPIREPIRRAPVRQTAPSTRQPVSSTRQPVSSTRQPMSSARQTAPSARPAASSTRQPVSSVRQSSASQASSKAPASKTSAQRPSSSRKTRPDLDEDFEFEFLDI